jgi:NitT/TauT family transport system substrate-binding protein
MQPASRELRVSTLQLVAYAPQFAAEALGYFQDEGLKVEFVIGEPDLSLARAVAQGQASLVLGSLLFALRLRGADGLVAIAQVNQVPRYVLAQRNEGKRNFHWKDLRGSVVLVPSQLPTAWAAFREMCDRLRIPLGDLRPIVGYSAGDALTEFLDGVGDFMMIDGESVQDPRVRVVAGLSTVLGRVPWSVYSCRRSFVEGQADALHSFSKAIDRALEWVLTQDSDEIAAMLATRFNQLSVDARVRAIDRYKDMGLWPASSKLHLERSSEWADAMAKWGLLPAKIPRSTLIDCVRSV